MISENDGKPIDERVLIDRSSSILRFNPILVGREGVLRVKNRGCKSNATEKKYVAVFVCKVTKAVHLVLAEDLTTAEFVQAFLRFTCIRGACTKLWSDHGRHFIRAEVKLARMQRTWDKFSLARQLQREGTK